MPDRLIGGTKIFFESRKIIFPFVHLINQLIIGNANTHSMTAETKAVRGKILLTL